MTEVHDGKEVREVQSAYGKAAKSTFRGRNAPVYVHDLAAVLPEVLHGGKVRRSDCQVLQKFQPLPYVLEAAPWVHVVQLELRDLRRTVGYAFQVQ